MEPVSLYNKDINDCIEIKQDTIDIKDPEWESLRCELTFYNFANFSKKSEEEQLKVENKMMKWIKKN